MIFCLNLTDPLTCIEHISDFPNTVSCKSTIFDIEWVWICHYIKSNALQLKFQRALLQYKMVQMAGAGRRPIIYNLFGRNLRFLKLLLPRSTLSIMWVLSALIPAGTVVSVTSIESTLTTSRNNCFISVFTCIYSPGRMLILERLIITLPAHDKKKKKKLI